MDDKSKTYTEDQLKFWNEQYQEALKKNGPKIAADCADWALYFQMRGPAAPSTTAKPPAPANTTP